MTLAVLLPLATLAALTHWAACRWYAAGSLAAWRHGFLSALLIGATYVWFISELLSILAALSPASITSAWLLAAIASATMAIRNRALPPPMALALPSRAAGLLGAMIAIALTLTAVAAWQSPPNTWDSMAYHMPRVAHWTVSGSLAFYPTHVPRQNFYLPGAELAILHLQLLSGGDHFANFVQWLSYAGSLVAASVLAASTGAGTSGQILAAAMAATLPMAIIQASSTKNDLVVSLWLLCLLIGTLAWQRSRAPIWAIWMGVSLGLALLTKISAWLYAVPMLGLAAWSIARERRAPDFHSMAIVVALALAFVAPFLARYTELLVRARIESVPLSAIAKPEDSAVVRSVRSAMLDNERYLNARMSPGRLFANVARNLGLHATLPIEEANRQIEDALHTSFAWVGISDPDSDTTYPRTRRFTSPGWSTHEDDAPNPLHLVAFAIALAISIWRWRDRATAELQAWFCVVAAGLLFCAALRWQPWHSRLHLPLFLLATAPAAVSWSGFRSASMPLAMVLAIAAVPALIANSPRSLVGADGIFSRSRAELYFANRRDLHADYAGAIAELDRRKCDDVGIVMHGNDWEYPLWALSNSPPRSFRHLCVANPTAVKAAGRDHAPPCAVVVLQHQPADRLDCTGTPLIRIWSTPTIQIYAPS